MAKYNYTTIIKKGAEVITCAEYTSLNKQVSSAITLVREIFDNETFPTPYIEETIKYFSNALKNKNTSKEKYSHSFLNGEIHFKMTRQMLNKC